MRTPTLPLLAAAAIALAAGATVAADALKSGPQPGEKTPAFDVLDVSGPNKGKELCYV